LLGSVGSGYEASGCCSGLVGLVQLGDAQCLLVLQRSCNAAKATDVQQLREFTGSLSQSILEPPLSELSSAAACHATITISLINQARASASVIAGCPLPRDHTHSGSCRCCSHPNPLSLLPHSHPCTVDGLRVHNQWPMYWGCAGDKIDKQVCNCIIVCRSMANHMFHAVNLTQLEHKYAFPILLSANPWS
jgi:hypothetical protein